MTEVTSENFDDLFPLIVDHIRKCDFVAIDAEFTGLAASEYLEPSLFDTPSQRFAKQRSSVSQFSICQFGLSTFAKDPSANRFEAKSFTFYLCPRSESNWESKKLLLNTNSIEFLGDHGFDFQKWLSTGIPYLNRTESRNFLRKWRNNEVINHLLDENDDRTDNLFDLFEAVKEFTISMGHEKLIPFAQSVNQVRNYSIVRTLRRSFPDLSIQVVNGHILVKKTKSDGLSDEHSDDSTEETENVFEYLRGFARIVDVIMNTKKMIVGHNMMVDLLFMYQHFVDTLPKTLSEFKRELANTFPIVYDTKTLYHEMKSDYPEFRVLMKEKSSGVHDLFARLSSKDYCNSFLYNPTIEQITEENAVTEHTLKKHDAGSDAFAAGFVFIRLVNTLIQLEERNPSSPPTLIQYVTAVEPYVNRVNLIRAATNYVNLAGDDKQSSRPPWIFVKKLKGNLDLSEVLHLIGKFGRIDGRMIGNREAIIATGNFATASEVIAEIKKTGDYDVRIYSSFRHNRSVRLVMFTTLVGSIALAGVFALKMLS